MRKKCSSCGLISFDSDEVCKKCGSEKLYYFDVPNEEKIQQPRKLPFWSYPIFFVLAVIVEIFALFPVLGNMGFKHTSNSPETDFDREMNFYFFLLNLPSAAIPYSMNQIIDAFTPLYLFVPLVQVIFWTAALIFLWKRFKKRNAAVITFAFLLTFFLLSLSIFR